MKKDRVRVSNADLALQVGDIEQREIVRMKSCHIRTSCQMHFIKMLNVCWPDEIEQWYFGFVSQTARCS